MELVADFRAIFSVSLWDVRGHELSYLIRSLLTNPESRFHAAAADWQYPISREGINQLDTLDVLLMRWAGDKFKPVARPWDAPPKKKVKKKRTRAEALRILRPHRFTESGSTAPTSESG